MVLDRGNISHIIGLKPRGRCRGGPCVVSGPTSRDAPRELSSDPAVNSWEFPRNPTVYHGVPWSSRSIPPEPSELPTVCGVFPWEVTWVHVGVPWVPMGISRVPTGNHGINDANHFKLRSIMFPGGIYYQLKTSIVSLVHYCTLVPPREKSIYAVHRTQIGERRRAKSAEVQ